MESKKNKLSEFTTDWLISQFLDTIIQAVLCTQSIVEKGSFCVFVYSWQLSVSL